MDFETKFDVLILTLKGSTQVSTEVQHGEGAEVRTWRGGGIEQIPSLIF